MADIESLKKAACEAIDKHAQQLSDLSQDIWSHPELNYEEHHAHAALTTFLEQAGFPKVERQYVVDTGFQSVYGDNGPNVAVLCEYDALPQIGHACGHNLIAEAGIGAGIGIKAAIDTAKAAGKCIGKVTVLGTPAEEGGGGKVDMIKAGAFKAVDVAMMVHPFPFDFLDVSFLTAIQQVKVKYFGKASHAAGFPWEGVNALDAAVMCYSNISVMRQQMKPTWRVHGVILNGGVKPNIIPEESQLEYYLRTSNMKDLEVLKAKAVTCFEAAATATGCRVEVEWHPKPFLNVITNPSVAKLFKVNANGLGLKFQDEEMTNNLPSGSTDMGNVSYEVPSIHPFYSIQTKAVNHSKDFTVASGDIKAQAPTIVQAKAMAMTAIDIFCQPGLLTAIQQDFHQQMEKGRHE